MAFGQNRVRAGLNGAFVTQQFEPSNIGVFEQILAGTIRSAQLQKAQAREWFTPLDRASG